MQNYTINSYHGSHIGNVDLLALENNFECIRSLFSGSSSPPNAISGMPWFHTTNELLKMKNKSNSAWIGIMYGDSDQKLWVYSNSAIEGWTLSTSPPTDKVLAFKGGSTYITGAALAGSWTQPSHKLTSSELPSHDHGATGAHTHTFQGDSSTHNDTGYQTYHYTSTPYATTSSAGVHTHNTFGGETSAPGSENLSHNHDSTYRPYAAVGTMQNPNI